MIKPVYKRDCDRLISFEKAMSGHRPFFYVFEGFNKWVVIRYAPGSFHPVYHGTGLYPHGR